MAEPIVLYGATGYTGRLVAAALCHRGLPFAIAGRAEAKMERLARTLPWRPAILTADAQDSAALMRAFAGRRVILNCAGPFDRLGEPIVAAAIAKGAHYADTTGEAQYMLRIAERHDAAARAAGVAVVPAVAYEVALADCAAAILAEGADVDEVEILYHLRHVRTSQGTARSALGVMRHGGLAYANGQWRPERTARNFRLIPMPILGRKVAAVSFPSGELASIPRHITTRGVKTFFALPLAAVPLAMAGGPLLKPLARWQSARLEQLFALMAEGPDDEHRLATAFQISVRLRRRHSRIQAVVTGRDMYGITGWILAYAAECLLKDQPVAGVLAPASVLEPARFFRELRQQHIHLHRKR